MAETPTSQDSRQAAVVSDHLPPGYTATFDGNTDDPNAATRSAPDLPQTLQESSLKLHGGDIHRDLFKLDARARLAQRSQTFSYPRRRSFDEQGEMTATEQQEPQGFRRQFVKKQRRFDSASLPVTSSFVEFLELYGAFAGEDLAESDDEAIASDDEERNRTASESRPLLGRRRSTRATRKGDASTTKTFFTLLKAFIGTGIMFLPKAFNNGGILFSFITLILVSIISMVAFHLLLQCRAQYGGGYGDIGRAIGGDKMRGIILASITLSQLGFVCAGTVFVAENLFSFCQAVTNGSNPLSTSALIGMQAIVIVPLAFVRNISKLGPAALLADIFIMIGLVYIWWYDIAALINHGLHPSVVLFNPKDYTLTIGASIFTFEGIGLILPIQSSMKNPQKFEWLLCVVMLIITVIFASVGALCYATFGSDTKIEIINNYPQTSKLVNAVQFLYAIAVLVGTPVQLFPALRIIEGKIFGHLSGKKDTATKWKKNGFRTFLVAVCIGIAIGGSSNLDRFVALIGSFACVPLVYIYPPLLHYRGIASTWYEKTGDVALMTLGFVGMVYTTSITVANSFL